MTGQSESLTVGAIQVESRNRDIEGNLARALPLVEEAAGKGATLICLPEFLPSGYIFDETAWEAAEPADGPTMRWLAEHAKRLNVTIGTSFLEAAGDGFKNAFVLMGPDREYGRVYKQDVALFENFFNEDQAGPHVIQTPFARVGVGICYENLRAFLSRLLVENDADILLQPHSCPGPADFAPGWIKRMQDDLIRDTAVRYARGLGIPALFVNKRGPFDTTTPMFPYLRYRAPFQGFTSIADSDGSLLSQVEKEQAVLVETVHLDPSRKTRRRLDANGNWAVRLPGIARWYMEFVGRRGRASYAKNPRRIAAARRAAGKAP